MMIRRLQSGPIAERARRSVREIGLAVVLTFAAIVFVGIALYRSAPETASVPQPVTGDRLPLGAQPVEGQAVAPSRNWDSTKDL